MPGLDVLGGGEQILADARIDRYRITEPEDGDSVTRVLFANGFGESSNTWQLLAERLVRIPVETGRVLEVFSYGESLTGPTAYQQSERDKRLREVTKYIVQSESRRQPVILMPHSRAEITVGNIGEELIRQGLVSGIVSMAGAGHNPLDTGELIDWAALSRSGRELLSLRNVRHGLGSLAVLHGFTDNIRRHVFSDLPRAREEVKAILTTDITPRTVVLSRLLGVRMVELVHLQDPFFPGVEVAEKLEGEFAGRIIPVDTSHNGFLVDPRLAGLLHRIITDVDRQSRAQAA